MKKFLFLAVMLCCSLWGFAQKTDVLMATLQHGDQVKVYYGQDAFKVAYEAAADSGDVITLSAGTFSTPSYVKKSLTVVGAGFETDADKGIYPTILSSYFHFQPGDYVNEDGEMVKEGISINGSRLEGLCIPGVVIYGTRSAENIQLVKCKLTGSLSLAAIVNNLTVRQCLLMSGITWSNYDIGTNILFINSVLNGSIFYSNSQSTLFFKNCIMQYVPGNSYTYENCILGGAPGNGSAVRNCILLKNGEGTYIGGENWANKQYAGIFTEEMTDLKWTEGKTYELKYPDTYIGTDGKQVGLYGGTYPYNPTPSTPQITRCEIDNATATDGTIKVKITVEAQTED